MKFVQLKHNQRLLKYDVTDGGVWLSEGMEGRGGGAEPCSGWFRGNIPQLVGTDLVC